MNYLTHNEIREKWYNFFESKGHLKMPSASLVPIDDDSLLFNNAGVTPLKKYLDGSKIPESRRIVNIQKCIRTNDIENVGVTKRHLTFFEMMGNFSIGDYFKNEAIEFAYEFLIDYMDIPKEKLYMTVYTHDTETKNKWMSLGIDESHLVLLDGNYWEIGEGPSGPDTEIFFDRGEEFGGEEAKEAFFKDEEQERFVEIWNNVFSQYNAKKGVKREDYEELPSKNIDTGAGLERWCLMFQNVNSIFDTDLFQPIIKEIEKIANKKYDNSTPFKVIADHIRCITMALSDKANFGNTGRDYVLRRLLRRSVRMGKKLGINEPFLYRIVNEVVDVMKESYPELEENLPNIQENIYREEKLFKDTLETGFKKLEELIKQANNSNKEIDALDVYRLYDTYGFPIDFTLEYLEEENITTDTNKVNELIKEHRDKSRNFNPSTSMNIQNDKLLNFQEESKFIEDTFELESEVIGVFDNSIILKETCFYAESGGQVGDTGTVENSNFKADVIDCKKAPFKQNLLILDNIEGNINVGDKLIQKINKTRRENVTKNHTLTHLLQKELQNVLGDVKQAGSYVDEDYLRFDFTYIKKIGDEEIIEVEKRVNERIKESIKRDIKYLPKEEAFKLNSMHLFGEKYSDIVRVVSFNDSIELCGGCHVENTSLIGKCAILSIESKGSNIYRIEATHEGFIKEKVKEKVSNYLTEIDKIINKSRNIIDSASSKNITLDFKLYFEEKELNSYESIVYYKNITESLKNDVIELEKEYKEKVKTKVLDQTDKYLSNIKEVNNTKYLIFGVKEIDVKTAKELLDNISNKEKEIFIFTLIKNEDSLAYVAKSTNKLSAVDYIKYFSSLTNGNGGGNNLLATGGTKEDINTEEVIKQLEEKLIEDINRR